MHVMKTKHEHNYLLLFAVLISLAVFYDSGAHEIHASEGKKLFTKHFDRTLFEITTQGRFSIEILLDDSEYPIGKNVIGVVIHNDRDEDVAGADIRFTLRNDQQSIPEPAIVDKNNGLYIVSGLDLRKDHPFSLLLSVTKNDVHDTAQFIFPECLNNLNPKGKYSP